MGTAIQMDNETEIRTLPTEELSPESLLWKH